MKRKQGLKRKTALKRSSKPLKRSRINPVSKTQQRYLDAYNDAKRDSDRSCVCCGNFKYTEPHHPKGRGKYILEFIWICHSLHYAIHKHPESAMRAGWLQPEYRGKKPTGNEKKPWTVQPRRKRCREEIEKLQNEKTD